MAEHRSRSESEDEGGSPRRRLRVAAALALGVALGVACERDGGGARAALAERRATWAREISALNEQQAVLSARLPAAPSAASPATAADVVDRRRRAVLDGTRQSIADVEIQLAQAGDRIEQAIREGGEAGERAMIDESARARGYFHGLGQQLRAAAQSEGAASRINGAAGAPPTGGTEE